MERGENIFNSVNHMMKLGYLKKVSCANYLIEIAYYFLHTVLDVIDRTAGLNVGQKCE